jgi:hypothetical protein
MEHLAEALAWQRGDGVAGCVVVSAAELGLGKAVSGGREKWVRGAGVMRVSAAMTAFLVCGACEAQLHGTGSLYVWNSTADRVEVGVEGRTAADVALSSQTGKLLEELVAGPYQLSVVHGGALGGIVGTELVRDRLTVFNVGSTACFARADVAGMYTKRKAPVRLLEVYDKQTVISIRAEIGVPPGQRLPATRKKSPFGFQRVAAVPCEIIGDDWAVEDFIQKLR